MSPQPATAFVLYCLTPAADRLPGAAILRCVAGEITAILGEVPREEYCGPDAEVHLRDLTWLAPRAARHEQIVEALMEQGPVLPARFATLFDSMENVRLFVGHHRAAILHFFEYLGEKREWAVKASWDSTAASRASASQATGAGYLAGKRRQAAERDRIAAAVREICQRVAREMEPLSSDSRGRRVWDPGGDGRTRPVLNRAYLLTRAQEPAFRTRLEALARQYRASGLSWGITGPWPAYSFTPALGEIAP